MQPIYYIKRSGRWVRVTERAYLAWYGQKRMAYTNERGEERRHG